MQNRGTCCLKSVLKYGKMGWSGGAMVLGKLPVPGRPTIWIIVGQGPTGLVVGAGGGCLDFFNSVETRLWICCVWFCQKVLFTNIRHCS